MERQKGLGGSDIAAALGVSPWKTQLELWGEKTGLAPSTFEGNEYTYWGTELEPAIANRFREEHKEFSLQSAVPAKAHKTLKFMRANVDGKILDATDGSFVGIWEAKTASVEFSEVPVHYQLQVQHYMFVLDRDFAIVSVLFGGNTYKEFRIERDPAYESELLPKLIEFWERVEAKLPAFAPVDMGDMKILMDTQGQPTEDHDLSPDSKLAVLLAGLSNDEALMKELQKDIKERKAKALLTMKDNGFKRVKSNGKVLATIVSVSDSPAFNMADFKRSEPKMFSTYNNKTRKGYVSLRVAK